MTITKLEVFTFAIAVAVWVIALWGTNVLGN